MLTDSSLTPAGYTVLANEGAVNMSELLDMLEAGMAGAARKLEPSCSRQHVHVCAAFPLIRT